MTYWINWRMMMLTINVWVFVILFLAFGFVSMLFGSAVILLREKMQKEEEQDIDLSGHELSPAVIIKNKDGQLVKEDKNGISVYDPEEGVWKSLN